MISYPRRSWTSRRSLDGIAKTTVRQSPSMSARLKSLVLVALVLYVVLVTANDVEKKGRHRRAGTRGGFVYCHGAQAADRCEMMPSSGPRSQAHRCLPFI